VSAHLYPQSFVLKDIRKMEVKADGGFANVYRGLHYSRNQFVAVKVAKDEKSDARHLKVSYQLPNIGSKLMLKTARNSLCGPIYHILIFCRSTGSFSILKGALSASSHHGWTMVTCTITV
jgi:hypothetical protein